MTIEDTIQAHLVDTANDPGVSGRVYFALAPERPTAPYIVFYFLSMSPLHSQAGPLALRSSCYLFSVFSTSQREATAIGKALLAALDGYTGAMGDYSVVFLQSAEHYAYEQETKLHSKKIEFDVKYRATA